MKKTIFVKIALAVLVFSFVMTACENKPKEQKKTMTDFELLMTEKDTSNVANLVDLFFDHVEHGQVTDAVAMLFQPTKENQELIEPLDNENIATITAMLRSFPIISHRIDYIKFNEVTRNEVKVTAVLANATDEMPEVKTVFYFRVVDRLGQWCLCMVNTNTGDERIISNTEADSLSTKYSDYQKEKENQRNSASE